RQPDTTTTSWAAHMATINYSPSLITDDLIRKVLVPQLDGERDIKADGRYYQYTYYFALSYKENNGKAYKLVWCIADDEPHILGIMDCFRIRKHDKEEEKALKHKHIHHAHGMA
ncbi:3775_t:CDS:2, partial [Entrophospora sp. SA101]